MPALIAGLIAALEFLFATQAGRWVLSILLTLGIGLTSHYAVVQPALDYAIGATQSQPALIAQWLGYFNFDIYLTTIGSAYLAGVAKRVMFTRLNAPVGGGTGY